MEKIQWGIIGCGDVTEVKSGPAFNKVPGSLLVAVMRRDEEKVKDYALRHNVPKWYTDAGQLINDPDVTAVYVATPPSSHEEYTVMALKAGKPVYVEKPMAATALSAEKMTAVAKEKNIKLTVAHYRRAQPLFSKVKELIDEKAIGSVRAVRLDLFKKALSGKDLSIPKTAWRVNSTIAGGGLFHDLAPHQLDLMLYFFGKIKTAKGVSANQAGLYKADDAVTGNILFENGVLFNGTWCFTLNEGPEKDECEIIGENGRLVFSFFDHKPVQLITKSNNTAFSFDPLPHVQQPMIEKVINFFSDKGPNPCTGEDGVTVMKLIESFTA